MTIYAIVATFFLGAFVRHNFHEMRAAHRLHRLDKKVKRDMAALQKKAEENAKKDQALHLPPHA